MIRIECPAGMLDHSGHFAGIAAKEMEEVSFVQFSVFVPCFVFTILFFSISFSFFCSILPLFLFFLDDKWRLGWSDMVVQLVHFLIDECVILIMYVAL